MDSTPKGTTTNQQPTRRLSDRDVKRITTLVIVALVLAWLIAFIVSNSEHVRVSFVFGHVSLSLIWVMVICAVLGALVALLAPHLRSRR